MSVCKPTVASFFSGIGGFDLGFERSGFDLVFQCEIDPFCNAILENHWNHVPKQTDIKKLSVSDVPAADVWVGGFPCQDVSLARMGKRDGLRGSRSGLFYDFARLVGERLPRVLLIENVPGLLSSHGGRDFGIVIRTLADLGYSVGWRVLNSRHFGVAQSRQRVFIVGCHRDRGGPTSILLEPECGDRDIASSRPNGQGSVSPFKSSFGDSVKGPIVQGIAYCLYACSARHTGTDWSRTYVTYPDGRVRRLTPRECEGIQGFPTDWTMHVAASTDVDKLDSLRYHALGNAVTVPVAEWLAQRIGNYLQSTEAPNAEETLAIVGA